MSVTKLFLVILVAWLVEGSEKPNSSLLSLVKDKKQVVVDDEPSLFQKLERPRVPEEKFNRVNKRYHPCLSGTCLEDLEILYYIPPDQQSISYRIHDWYGCPLDEFALDIPSCTYVVYHFGCECFGIPLKRSERPGRADRRKNYQQSLSESKKFLEGPICPDDCDYENFDSPYYFSVGSCPVLPSRKRQQSEFCEITIVFNDPVEFNFGDIWFASYGGYDTCRVCNNFVPVPTDCAQTGTGTGETGTGETGTGETGTGETGTGETGTGETGTGETGTGETGTGETGTGTGTGTGEASRFNCEDPFGAIAQKFNLFVLEDYQCHDSSIEGRLAVGGKLDMSNFAIGCGLYREHADSLEEEGCIPFGSVPCSTLSDHGEYPETMVVAGEFNANTVEIKAGNVVHGPVYNGVGVEVVSDCSIREDNVVDFQAARTYLEELSMIIKDEPETGYKTQFGGHLIFHGSGQEVEVFNIPGEHLELVTAVTVTDADTTATIIFNVNGQQLSVGNFGFYGIDPHKAVWNFHEATSLSMYQVHWRGVVFAPFATIKNATGQTNGQIFSKAWISEGPTCMSMNYMQFEGCLPIFRANGGSQGTTTGGAPICGENWECEDLYGTGASCHQGRCACYQWDGELNDICGGAQSCTCQCAPDAVKLTDNTKYCTAFPGCAFDWQCNSGQVCSITNSELGLGTCACSVYGTDENCECHLPNQTVWSDGTPYCLTPEECIFGWNCDAGQQCVIPDGEVVGTCSA